jgi:ribonuclease HI
MNGITVFTDGASRGNPGPGGWGAIVIDTHGKVVELGGAEDTTTNNRMELSAVRAALSFIEERKLSGDVVIHTDSAYVLQGSTGWIYGWEKNGWKTKTGEPVLNQDIWKELGALLFRMQRTRTIVWEKVKGHAGHVGNERADVIATSFADKERTLLFVGDIVAYENLVGGPVDTTIPSKSTTSPATKKSASRRGAAYSYVSRVDGVVKTHATWAECKTRVSGASGAKYQKVFSKEEERDLIEAWTR